MGVPAVAAAASLHHVAVVVVGVAAATGPGRHDVGGVLEAVGENVRRRFALGPGDGMGAAAAAITVAQAVLAQQVAQGVVAEFPPVGADTVVGGDAGQAVEQVIIGGCPLFPIPYSPSRSYLMGVFYPCSILAIICSKSNYPATLVSSP